MQFNNFATMRESMWRGSSEQYLRWFLTQPNEDGRKGDMETLCACLELSWLTHDRPYYNVYPIVVELCIKTSLNMKWGDITFPVRALLLRFASGQEPLGMKTAIVRVPSDVSWATPVAYHESRTKAVLLGPCFPLLAKIQGLDDLGTLWAYAPTVALREQVISDTIDTPSIYTGDRDDKVHERVSFLIRLLAFIGLLARGTDLVTPAILASDRTEYDATNDESRKRWLEERARKKLGNSFDVGRSLEIERASSPHWRSPHLALFHTGVGGRTPVLKVRSGCVVVPRDMSSVPTGYLGKESEQELDRHPGSPVFRTHVSKRIRFLVMRRDGYRCRLCGMTRDDGVTLEVDHIVAVANGGRTEESNLWTLCHPCNNGKSSLPLREDAAAAELLK